MIMFQLPMGGRFEGACYRIGPRFHSWVYSTWCGLAGEWLDAVRWRLGKRWG